MRRKIENASDARRCLKAAAASGLNIGAWARAHGVDGRSLNAWRINLAEPQPPRLVELVAAPQPSNVMSSARYLVRVGEHAIELDAHFQEATLVRLVRALRAC